MSSVPAVLGRLASRRWIGLTVLVVFLVLAFYRLGVWQWDRFEAKGARNDLVETNSTAAPVPIGDVAPVGGSVQQAVQFRRVEATGTYDTAGTVLVRNRSFDGAKGFEVLVPLVTRSGPALLVDRGWVPAGETATAAVAVPVPPAGTVAVQGWLRSSEPASARERRAATTTPQRTVVRIDVPTITDGAPYPFFAGYTLLAQERPAPASRPQPLELPVLTEGLNLAYALQWWLFAGIAVVGWVLLLRRDLAEDRAGSAEASVPV